MPVFLPNRPSKSFGLLNPVCAVALACLIGENASAQEPPINLVETKVRPYTLPDPLLSSAGRKIVSSAEWQRERRPELLRLFEAHVYGEIPKPARTFRPKFQVRSADENALAGTAIRREVAVLFSDNLDGPRMDLLIYLPKAAARAGRVPAYLGLNFAGNHSVHHDPGITLSRQWMRDDPKRGITGHQATESSRGGDADSWPVERILKRGYALVTAYYGDVDPDYDDGFKNGVHPLFYQPGQGRPGPAEWGSIAAWAWGLSRALDYLVTAPEIDAGKVVLMGHSRLGKTALWAGAEDTRFAVVISVQSGCGGAALSRRDFGETVERINTSFPHWFCANFRRYNAHEDLLPVDQHELIALIAPRPVLICSAAEDLWADPKGEFLAAVAADPVYRLLGTDGFAVTEMPNPAPDQLVKSTIGYHIRPGKHAVTTDDWDAFMNFADHHLGRAGRPTPPLP
jgi:hypothetical protein